MKRLDKKTKAILKIQCECALEHKHEGPIFSLFPQHINALVVRQLQNKDFRSYS